MSYPIKTVKKKRLYFKSFIFFHNVGKTFLHNEKRTTLLYNNKEYNNIFSQS